VIRIHHVSDVHFGPSQYKATNWFGFLPQAAARNTEAYVSHLERLPASSFPDLIIVSGDLATFASEKEMHSASDFITKILDLDGWAARKALPPGSPRILVVPGNHDLDWSKTSPEERHERYDRLSNGLFGNGQVISSRYHDKKVDPCFDFGDEANLFIYLLNSTHYGGTDDPVLKKIYEAITENPGWVGISEEEKKALSRKVKNDPGFVLDKDIKDLRSRMAQVPPTRTKIAVIHHNPNHVPSDDRDNFDTIVNAGPLKAVLLQCGFDLVLHGHRHIFHCSVESHPAAAFSNNRCYFLSADSLGVKEDARFLELDIARQNSETTVDVREYNLAAPTMGSSATTRCRLAVGQSEAQRLATLIGTAWTDDKPDAAAKAAIDAVLPKLQELQARLTQWAHGGRWIDHFHFQLKFYRRLWATAPYDRATMLNPAFQSYLREQYHERTVRIRRLGDRKLYFSPDVRNAMTRCQFPGLLDAWPGYEIAEATEPLPWPLEIARIIIIDSKRIDRDLDIPVLANLAYDHAQCAIPLFAIDKQFVRPEQNIDFAVGIDQDGQPVKGCAFDAKTGEVEEVRAERSDQLLGVFKALLKHSQLRSLHEFVGQGRMWTDPRRVREWREQYERARKASPLLERIIKKHLPGGGQCGVDLCCGTGNYTAPFRNQFQKLYGIDISPEMLASAKEKVSGVEWIQTDAKDTTLPEASCDAAWMISGLHYFIGKEQLLLFQEIHRILKAGGVFVADTEFSEQHPSLWIVDYFPSLRERFKDRLFPQEQYRAWLTEAGFHDIDFAIENYLPEERDAFLRIGQHRPALYLDEAVREGIPAFQIMDAAEKRSGLARLEKEISNGKVEDVRERYRSKATLPGDLGIIIARK
jgi:ubiquinone/menaquinone biosynthesis C-methylase UbiE/3',5'-cyclic AMP phosphodiesterase CpdA